jgi:hypothetical protein
MRRIREERLKKDMSAPKYLGDILRYSSIGCITGLQVKLLNLKNKKSINVFYNCLLHKYIFTNYQ